MQNNLEFHKTKANQDYNCYNFMTILWENVLPLEFLTPFMDKNTFVSTILTFTPDLIAG